MALIAPEQKHEEVQSIVFTSTPEEVQQMIGELQDNNAWQFDDAIGTLASGTVTNVTQALFLADSLKKNKELYDELAQLFKCVDVIDSCECVGERICSDSTLYEKFCGALKSCAERFSKHFPNEMGANHGDADVDKVKEIYNVMNDKHKELHETCSPSKFEKGLNTIHKQYMLGCFVCLVISWTYIYQTTIAIQESSAELQRLAKELDKLRRNDIDPIVQFIQEVQRAGFIRNKIKYERFKIRIDTTVKLLNEYKKQIEKEKSKMQLKGFNNVISTVAMITSCVTSFNMSGGTKLVQNAMKVTGVLQGATAAAHSVAAGVCFATYFKLNKFCIELKQEIKKLHDAGSVLNECYEEGRRRRQNNNQNIQNHPNCAAYAWNATQVANWLREHNFNDVADVFESEGVEGPDLLDMDSDTLDSIMSLVVWKQNKLLRKINELKRQ